MHRRISLIFMAFVLAAATFCWGDDKDKHKPAPSLQSGVNTDYERHRDDLNRLNEALKARGYQPMPEMPTGPNLQLRIVDGNQLILVVTKLTGAVSSGFPSFNVVGGSPTAYPSVPCH